MGGGATSFRFKKSETLTWEWERRKKTGDREGETIENRQGLNCVWILRTEKRKVSKEHTPLDAGTPENKSWEDALRQNSSGSWQNGVLGTPANPYVRTGKGGLESQQ